MGKKAAVLAVTGVLLGAGVGAAAAGTPSPSPAAAAPSAVPATRSPAPAAAPSSEQDAAELRRCLQAAAARRGAVPAGCERFTEEIADFVRSPGGPRVPRATPAPAVPGEPRFTG